MMKSGLDQLFLHLEGIENNNQTYIVTPIRTIIIIRTMI